LLVADILSSPVGVGHAPTISSGLMSTAAADDIRNTRQIDRVYFNGIRLDRDTLLARWKRPNASH
jgi:hypothetical protein